MGLVTSYEDIDRCLRASRNALVTWITKEEPNTFARLITGFLVKVLDGRRRGYAIAKVIGVCKAKPYIAEGKSLDRSLMLKFPGDSLISPYTVAHISSKSFTREEFNAWLSAVTQSDDESEGITPSVYEMKRAIKETLMSKYSLLD
jgi:hypothetical protein